MKKRIVTTIIIIILVLVFLCVLFLLYLMGFFTDVYSYFPQRGVEISGNPVDNDFNNMFAGGKLVREDDKLYYIYDETFYSLDGIICIDSNAESFYEIVLEMTTKKLVLSEIAKKDIRAMHEKEFVANHFARLAEGKCCIEVSPYYSSTIAGLERVTNHLINVGYSIVNPIDSQSET